MYVLYNDSETDMVEDNKEKLKANNNNNNNNNNLSRINTSHSNSRK